MSLDIVPAQAGTQQSPSYLEMKTALKRTDGEYWMPAFAGRTATSAGMTTTDNADTKEQNR